MTTHTATCPECGYTTTSKTEKLANHGIALHSCEKTRRKAASRARRLARSAAVDRTPKLCLHKRTEHVHGTHACYVLDKCRCNPCSTANAAYEQRRARLHAYGRFTHLVDAQPAREHARTLMAQGLGLKTLAKVSGVSHGALTKLVYGNKGRPPSKRIQRDIEARILTVRATNDTLAPGAVIDSIGTRRRLQALMTLGWSQTRLATHLGYQTRNFGHLINGKRGVTVATARAVRTLYDQLWNTRPPIENRWQAGGYSRSIKYANDRGWLGPMWWDDESIDDPRATPDLGDTSGQGAPPRLIHADDITDCIEWGLDLPGAAHRLRIPANSIEIRLTRDARYDLLDALAANGPDPQTCECGRTLASAASLRVHIGKQHPGIERKTA